MKLKPITEKTMLFLLFLLAATVVSGQSWNVTAAPESKKVTVTQIGVVRDWTAKIRNTTGDILLNEYFNGNKNPGKVFNLENVEPGLYTLTLMDERGEQDSEIEITEEGVICGEKTSFFPAPNIRFEDQKLDVSFLNQAKEDVQITIRNNRGDVVFQEEIGESYLLEKRYDLKELARGNYQLVVQTSRKSYYKDLAINY